MSQPVSIAEALNGQPVEIRRDATYVIRITRDVSLQELRNIDDHISKISVRFGCRFLLLPAGLELVRDSELNLLGHWLALQTAADCIAASCEIETLPDGKWMRIDPDDVDDLSDELKYVELRGKLFRNSDDAGLIRIDVEDER